MSKIFRIAAKMGYIQFKEAGRYVMQEFRKFAGNEIADKLSIENLQAGYINIATEIGRDKKAAMMFDSLEELIGANNFTDQRSSPDLESDSPTAVTNPVGAQGVQTGRGRDGGTGKSGVRPTQGGSRGNGGVRVPGRETALAGESGNLTVYTGTTAVSGSAAGNNVDPGSDSDRLQGPSPDHIAAEETAKAARSRSQQR